MARRMALCVDEVSARNPELIGLEGELIDMQEWLEVFTSGEEARSGIAADDAIGETWVVSCDDVEPINLAATLKADSPDRCVRLVTEDACGSLCSRAYTARIDEVFELGALPRRYAEAKRALCERGGAMQVESPVAAGEAVVLERPVSSSPAVQLLDAQPQPELCPVAAAADGRAFVLTVVSGSGGAGKSSVSALSAVIAQGMGHRTLLLDCDLQFGDVASMVGEKHPVCIDEVIMRPDRIEAEVMRDGALSVLAAPARLEASEEAVRHLPELFERLAGLFDVIVVNTGASWAEQHAVLLERSSAALFLIDQRVSSVHACRHALELCARCGIAANPFQFALNRCAKGAPLTSIDVSCALQGASVHEFKDGGRDVEDYLSAGGAADLLAMGNDFAMSVEAVMGHVLPAGDRRFAERAIESQGHLPLRRRTRRFTRKRGEK